MKKRLFAVCLLALLIVSVAAADGHPFADVPEGAWYSDAVQWAWESGIVNGVDATHFEPDRPITRAEMVTLLWRMNGGEVETPRTLADLPYGVPAVEQRIVPGYEAAYYGHMTIGGIYSVGIYDTLDQALVNESDAGFRMKRAGGCQLIGDHDSEGMWIIRWCGPGDTLELRLKTGEVQRYKWIRTDPHVTNKGSDVWDANGESLFFQLPESGLILCCCNDSEGKDMTATFWARCG